MGQWFEKPSKPQTAHAERPRKCKSSKMEDISAIAWKLGIGDGELMPMGIGKAKITWDALKIGFPNPGSLILLLV